MRAGRYFRKGKIPSIKMMSPSSSGTSITRVTMKLRAKTVNRSRSTGRGSGLAVVATLPCL